MRFGGTGWLECGPRTSWDHGSVYMPVIANCTAIVFLFLSLFRFVRPPSPHFMYSPGNRLTWTMFIMWYVPVSDQWPVTIPYSIRSVENVWAHGAKTTQPIENKFVFSEIYFFRSEKFQASTHVLQKYKVCCVKSRFPRYKLLTILAHCRLFLMGNFNETFRLWTFVKHLLNYWVDRIETWNFSLPKKIDSRKNNVFCDWSSSCSRYTNRCDRTKRIGYCHHSNVSITQQTLKPHGPAPYTHINNGFQPLSIFHTAHISNPWKVFFVTVKIH
jgi:hypothetical protein